MFYDIKLMTNSPLSGPWRVANCQEMKQNGNSKLSNICKSLDYLITNDDHSPLERLSLRTSSILIEGTARLFKSEVDRLLEDIIQQTDNRQGPLDEDWDEFERSCMTTYSDSNCSFLENRSPDNGNEINNMPNLRTSTMVKEDIPNAQSSPKMKRDKAVQTSGQESNNEERNSESNQDLPYCLVLIHDKYGARRPTKILLSSLDPAVKDI